MVILVRTVFALKVKQSENHFLQKHAFACMDIHISCIKFMNISGLRVECNATLKQADQTEMILPVTWVEKKDGK